MVLTAAMKSGLHRTQVICLDMYPVQMTVPVTRELSPVNTIQRRLKSRFEQRQMKIRVKVRKRSIVRNQRAVVLWKRVELCESVKNQLQLQWFQPKAVGSAHLPYRGSVLERHTSRRAHKRRISLVMDKREF